MSDATQTSPTSPQNRPWLMLVSLVLVALNLRPALSSMAPVLGQVSEALGLSASQAGLLTTLPVLCLGLFAPLAPWLSRRLGSEGTVFAVLLALMGGILLRSNLGSVGLFAGSLLSGASIGIIGVRLPGIVKRDFPAQAGLLTGVYTMALCLGAALAAGSTVPLTRHFGDSWRIGLGIWVIPALLAALCWLPHLLRGHGTAASRRKAGGLLRNRLAWQVTLFMGLQSSLAYIVFGWLPSILIGRGLSPVQAGVITSASIIVQMFSSLAAPWLASRGRDQRLAVVAVMLLTLCGLFGCLYAPVSGLWGWAVVLGLGQGGSFSLALALIVLRSPDAQVAGSLSGMAQGVGYTLASLGPLAVGILHDWSGGWTVLGWLFGGVGLLAMLFGLGAGRALQIRLAHRAAAE